MSRDGDRAWGRVALASLRIAADMLHRSVTRCERMGVDARHVRAAHAAVVAAAEAEAAEQGPRVLPDVLLVRACCSCGQPHRALRIAPPDVPCSRCLAREAEAASSPPLPLR